MELSLDTLNQALDRMHREPDDDQLNVHINTVNQEAYMAFLRETLKHEPPPIIDDLPRLIPRLITDREVKYVVDHIPREAETQGAKVIIKTFRQETKANLQRVRTVVTRAMLNQMAERCRVSNIPLNPRIVMRAKADAPVERKLTLAEIDMLLSALPAPKTPDPLVRAVIYAIERYKLKQRLLALKMVVTAVNLKDLSVEIREQYELAIIEAGNMVGSHMDNTMAASITQTMFNTFGMVGKASTVGSGAQTMENLLYTVADRNDAAMSIHFRLPFTHRDVVELRYILVETLISDLLVKDGNQPKVELGVYVIPNRPDPTRLEEEVRFEAHAGYASYENDHDLVTGYPSHIIRGRSSNFNLADLEVRIKRKIDPDFVFDLISDGKVIDFVPRYDIDTLASTNSSYNEALEAALSVFKTKVDKKAEKGVFIRHDRDDPIRLAAARHLGVTIRAPWWHQIYARTLDEEFRYAQHVLRFYVDTQKLYNHGLTLTDLVNVMLPEDREIINVCQANQKVKSLDEAWYHAIASPTQYGYIDIIPRLSQDMEGDHQSYEDASIIYLNRLVKPRLFKTKIKGVNGITSLTPIEVNYLALFKSSQRLNDGRWRIALDITYIRNNGIVDADIRKFLLACGFQDIEFEPNVTQGIVIETLAQMDIDVTPFRNKIYNSAVLVRTNDAGSPEDIMSAAIDSGAAPESYVYAVCTGTNLKDVIRFPWVDDTRTITNNIHEMSDTFGVEAARFYYLYEIAQVMADSGAKNTDFHNLLLLGDYIFGYGIPLGVKQNSLQRRGEGYLTMGLTEKLADTFKAAAAVGSRQTTRSMIASVFTGQWSRSGSFAYDVDQDPKSIEFIANVIAQEKQLREYRKHPERFPGIRGPPAPEVSESALEAVRDFEYGPVLVTKVARRKTFATQIEADAMLEDDLNVYPWLPVIPHPTNTLNVLTFPPWVTEVISKYQNSVSSKYLARKEPVAKDVFLVKAEATPPVAPVYTYMRPDGGFHLYLPAWDAVLQSHGFQLTKPIYDHVDYLELSDNHESYLNFADIKARLVNRISGSSMRSVINKSRLYVTMVNMFPEFAKLHMAKTFAARHFDADKFFQSEDDVAIVRHTGANTGFGVKVVTSQAEIQDFQRLILNQFHNDEAAVKAKMGTMLVSRYITNPLLYQGRKFHLRMYAIHAVLMTKNGLRRKTGLCSHGEIITARAPYVKGDWTNAEIHNTHPVDGELIMYPRDLIPELGQTRVTNMHRQMEEITEKIHNTLDSTHPPHGMRNAYMLLELDIMFIDDRDTAILIEVNPSSLLNYDLDDQFADERRIISKSITDWLFANVFQDIFDFENKETKILIDAIGDYSPKKTYNTINMGEFQYETTQDSINSIVSYLKDLNANIVKLRSIVNMGRD